MAEGGTIDARRAISLSLSLAVAALLAAGAWLAVQRLAIPELVVFDGPVMGTYYSVKIAPPHPDLDRDALAQAIDDELQRINGLMSTYRPDSELSRFNAHVEADWFPVSADTATVVAEALAIGELTDGALDVTVGPLVNLWGFGPDTTAPARPDDEALARARDRVGLDQLQVRLEPPALRKQRPDLYVDLSSIAKGYAVDEVATVLASRGIGNALIDVGGELRALGERGPGQPWRIAVERPDAAGRTVQRILTPGARGIATSGDYRNYFVLDDRRYSHLIDPRTGEPVQSSLASVSVVSDTAMRADGLATALLVMDLDQALAFAEARSLAVLLIARKGETFVEHASRAMRPLLADGSG